ncbi:MAG: ABC transporter ATP-binding protein [SAR86 cluster bacterium]|uniref:ABC transporter ATP-binding protein n=1 Tax=SAR86 cluster bacterium TaxID=2030880 RepID=A0A937LFM7_9GAMM|nr:ABC transporter ATP-binding protein [SAR86 cluster bacterium]RCL40720.1 MAG: ABC transporter ATP-binding protein [Gammaproteobacteria bacterium]|tara:strand:+ start:186 stop:845 length:660 start_codon:yes stop_codon:yes gene_type:complete
MIIEARNLSKKVIFNNEEIIILDDINLNVSASSSLAVIGPSGSGKSTLLGILAGLDSPTSGEIFINKNPLHSLSEEARAKVRKDSVAFVFQNFELLSGLTALENVMLPLELKSNKGAKEIAINYLEKVDMQNRLMHYPQQLSGGEQQRVAIARAFACEAEVLFCDEPTGNLDSNNSDLIADLIFGAFRESSSALIIVTHDETLANRCDQKIELLDGKIL